MGELGDDFRAWKEYKRKKKEKRNTRIPFAMETLKKSEFSYRTLNDYPMQIRVDGRADWWPTTSYWRFLDGSRKGTMIGPLLRALRETA